MNKTIIFSIILLLIIYSCFGQTTINGTVVDEQTEESIAGATISLKETSISTTTDYNGRFQLTINDTSKVLVVSYVGYVTREVILNGQTDFKISISIKPYVIYEAWDQKVRLNVNCGILNNPYGVGLGFSVPLFRTSIALNSNFNYQMDFLSNHALETTFGISNIRLNSNLVLIFDANFRNIKGPDNYIQKFYSLESKWSLRHLKAIVGYGQISLDMNSLPNSINSAGLVTGLETWIPKPISTTVLGKVTIFKKFAEYNVEVSKKFNKIYTFAKYYNSKSYSEVSLGIGMEFTYYFRYQKNSNKYATQQVGICNCLRHRDYLQAKANNL